MKNGEPRRSVVMLVDDSADMGLIVTLLGKRFGQEMRVFQEGEGAWLALEKEVPDLLLLDINLPGLSGVELCQRIRQHPEWSDLPIALFTHETSVEDIARGLESGADYFVDKRLVADPSGWKARLEEIFQDVARKGEGREEPQKPVGDSPILQPPRYRQLAPRLRQALLRKAVREVLPEEPENSYLCENDDVWLAELPPQQMARVLAKLAEQVWKVLGTEETTSPGKARTTLPRES